MATKQNNEVLMTLEVDVETGVETLRELTAEEIADFAKLQSESQARDALIDAQAKSRASALAKLKKLGLTDKEIEAL
jgi:hypothetical protein